MPFILIRLYWNLNFLNRFKKKKSWIILPLKDLRRFRVYVLWYDMRGTMYRVASIRFAYSNIARQIVPCICHTIRHIHGNDIIPLREVWFVIFYTDGLAVLHHAQHCDGQWLILDSYCASFKLLCHVVRMRVLTSNSHIANDTWLDVQYRIAVLALTRCALCYRVVTSHWIFNGAACYRKNLWRSRSSSCNKVISLGTPAIRHIHVKILKYQTSWKSMQWEQSCSMQTDRRIWHSQ